MHDLPYTVCPGPEVTAAMTVISAAVRKTCPDLTLGVQILCAANQQAIAVALAAGNRNDSSVITVVCYGIYSLQIVHCTNIDTMKNETRKAHCTLEKQKLDFEKDAFLIIIDDTCALLQLEAAKNPKATTAAF